MRSLTSWLEDLSVAYHYTRRKSKVFLMAHKALHDRIPAHVSSFICSPSFQSSGIPIGQTQLEAKRTRESIKVIHESQHTGEESRVEGVESGSGRERDPT